MLRALNMQNVPTYMRSKLLGRAELLQEVPLRFSIDAVSIIHI